jgi:hypothetical protein
MASSRSEPIEWPALKVHCAVDFEIERHALAAAHVLDDDMMHRQTQARPDQQHAFDDRLVVERDRIGGDGQIRLRPLLAAPRRKLRLDRATRSIGSVRGAETMSSRTIRAPLVRSRIASVPATPGVWATRGRIASVCPLGAWSTRASIVTRPEAIARDGDKSGDADGGE